MAKNVLYIIERMGPGGTEKQLFSLINGFAFSEEINPFLCTLKPSIGLLDAVNCPIIELHINRLFIPKLLPRMSALKSFCKSNRIDIVQTFFQDPTLIGLLQKLQLPVKLIVSFRDMGFWRTPYENLKMKLAYRYADGFIANSEAVKAHYAETDKIDPHKIRVIYNGISEEHILDLKKVKIQPNGDLVVGIVGNCNRSVKRIGDFIEAAALIIRHKPKVRFVVIGDGDQRPWLQQRCHELKIDDRVQFRGMLTEPLKAIKEFSIGVNTSETEGFSNAVIEMMASGVPMVVTDTGGNRELVEEGKNGYRVPVADFRACAQRIIELLDNPDRCHAMAIENIVKVAQKYSATRMIREHENYYLALSH